MGAGGSSDGEEVYSGRLQDGCRKVFAIKIKFVRFVRFICGRLKLEEL